MKPHPMQPLFKDEGGVVRFRENKVVAWLLDNGGVDMNRIALQCFADDERAHFAQLIGYSVDGYADRSYVDEDTYWKAHDEAAALDESFKR